MRKTVIAVVIGFMTPVCWAQLAHEGERLEQDDLPAYSGPGYRRDAGGASPVTFPSSGVQLLSWLPLTDFDPLASDGNSCFGYTSPSGQEYALIGTRLGTGFVNISNPGNAQIVAHLPGVNSIWRDIRVYGHYAYAISEGGGGIQVFDMNQIDNGVVTLVNTVTASGTVLTTLATHTLAINTDSGYLYRCGGQGGGGVPAGLRIYSLADPANPVFVKEWTNFYVHESQVVNYTSGPFAGHEIAFCYLGGSGVAILDVTNKANIIQLSFFNYPSLGYAHQGCLTEDRQYVYIDDELDSLPTTRIINVADLTNPFYVGNLSIGTTSIDHNLYTKGNRMFQANYRSGLGVFDTTNPLAPVRIAFFDTFPANDSANFNGLWNNYPYFASGVVIGSDIESGLFVWWIGNPILTYSYPNGLPAIVNPDGAPVRVTITEDTGAYRPGTAKLHYDLGNGYVTTPMTLVSGTTFDAALPATNCGQTVSYYFTAESTNNITWRDPASAPDDVYTVSSSLAQTLVQEHTMESAAGWVAGAAGDNATSGVWVRVNPNATAAQPEDDHSPGAGTFCWVTGQGAVGANQDSADVDGGRTTLNTPTIDLTSTTNPAIGYWRWYSNSTGANPGADVFRVDISNNNGTSWTNVETVGPTGPYTSGGWHHHQFLVGYLLPPTAQVKLRFVAADEAAASTIEAAIDDLQVLDEDCGILAAPAVTSAGSRHLAATPGTGNLPTALLVTSDAYPCLLKYVDTDGTLVDMPVLQAANDWGTVFIHGHEIVPATVYHVQSESNTGTRSILATATTDLWADVDGNLVVNFTDIQLMVQAFQGDESVSRQSDLVPCEPNGIVNFADIQRAVKAYQGESYSALGCGDPCVAVIRIANPGGIGVRTR